MRYFGADGSFRQSLLPGGCEASRQGTVRKGFSAEARPVRFFAAGPSGFLRIGALWRYMCSPEKNDADSA